MSETQAAQTNFTRQTIISRGPQCRGNNLLVYYNPKSRYVFRMFCLFYYGPFLTNLLQRPMPFTCTTNLNYLSTLLMDTKSGSLTLVDMRVGLSQGASPSTNVVFTQC
jgi:hypothetical protein